MGERKITLKAALKAGNLEAFVAQAEARGAPTGDMAAFDKALNAAIKQPRSKRQTSRSPSRGGSGGK
jgi:hypothetical protein